MNKFERTYLFSKEKTFKLLKNGAGHVFLGSFITKFITFFGSIFLVRFLTKSEYGVLSYYENILGYFCIFAGFGLATGIQRYLILAESESDKKGCYLFSFMRGNLWNILLCVLCLFFCFTYQHPSSFYGYPVVIICLTLCVPFIYICNLSLNAFRALFDYRCYAYLAIVTAFFLVLARVLGAAVGGLNLSVIGRLLAEFFCAFICVYVLFSKHFRKTVSKQPQKEFKKQFQSYSFQMMLTDGLWAIFMLNDILLLGQITGNDTLIADYKIAYVIPANLSIVTSSICVFTAPYFTQKDKDGNTKWLSDKLKESLIVTMSIIGVIALICILLGAYIIEILFGNQYLSSLPIMNILLFASFFNNGIRAVIANFLSAIGEQKVNLIVAAIGIIIQIALNIILIPSMGAMGVGISSLSVYLVMSIILLIVVKNRIKL